MVFGQNLKILTLVIYDTMQKHISEGELNGTNFSFIAPSSEELV